MSHYYAIEWTYGRASDEHGERAGIYYAFGSCAQRDAWVDDGPPYVTQAGSREAIPASDPELRRIRSRWDADLMIQRVDAAE